MEQRNTPKVSVIVPIYRVEKYIEKCAVYLLEQTLDDIEIIFIDDCSPDNSMKVLEETLARYPERKDCVRVYRNPQNCGLVANRKKGIELATGEYITHCDSDDWVDRNLYEALYNKAKETNSDVAVCPFRWEYADKSYDLPLAQLPNTCHELLVNWYRIGTGMNHCNKIIRRSILIEHDLYPYEDTGAFEDASMMFRAFYYAGGLTQIDNAVYHYNRTNLGAVTSQVNRKSVDRLIRAAGLVTDFFKAQPDYEEYKKTCLVLQYFAKLDLVNTSFEWLKDFHKIYPKSDAIVNELSLMSFSSKGRFRFWFVKHHLAWLFVLMFKVYSKIKK